MHDVALVGKLEMNMPDGCASAMHGSPESFDDG